MKDCTRFAPLVGAREGELEAAEARALSAHLESCAACRAVSARLAATEGLVAESLLARANARDFSPFVDQVMTRVYGTAGSPQGVLGWMRAHWRAMSATVVPALAALALFLYVRNDAGRVEVAALEMDSVGVSTVIQTQDGPVVLIDDDDDDTGT